MEGTPSKIPNGAHEYLQNATVRQLHDFPQLWAGVLQYHWPCQFESFSSRESTSSNVTSRASSRLLAWLCMRWCVYFSRSDDLRRPTHPWYGIFVTVQNFRKIEKIQYREPRYLYNDFTASRTTLREMASRLMYVQRLLQMMIKVYKFHHNTGPVYMENRFNMQISFTILNYEAIRTTVF